MPPRTHIAIALLAAALFTGSARAQVYSWVDKDGTVHFGEEPPTTGERARKLRLPPVEPRPAAPVEERLEVQREVPPPERAAKSAPTPPAPQPASAARPAATPGAPPSVELYTTTWCPWCKKAREYFNTRGIAFTERDIEKATGAREKKYGLDRDKRVPVAIIGDRLVRGYAPAQYQAALERR